MDKLIMDFNVGTKDKVNRLIVGFGLIIFAMTMSGTPPWIALAALYPILTAIVAWDPVYAVYTMLSKITALKLGVKQEKLALS